MSYASVGVFYMNEYNPMKSLKEFHSVFAPDQVNDDVTDQIERRMNLVEEEFEEVMHALNDMHRYSLGYNSLTAEEAMIEVASELADLLYVVYGTAEELGIPLDKVFNAIHKANMSKVWDDGQVHRNDFGKVIKPPNFKKADIREVLYGSSVEKSTE